MANVTIARPDRKIEVTQDQLLWSPQAGQQEDLMLRYEFETFIGGEKGSGKSWAAIGWLVRGNLDKSPDDPMYTPVDMTYVNSPKFRAAVIRRNIDDLNDWVGKAKVVYEAMGAKLTKQPYEFTWPSGAKVIMLHMSDKDSYMRVTGQQIIRLFWDEVTFEPNLDTYIKVFSSIRSSDKRLRPQILLAANPEGPGLNWVKQRFVKYRDEKGNKVPPGQTIKVPSWDPINKKTVYTTRVFLAWQLAQNRILLDNDPAYIARLASIPNESLRRAYLYGDWDAAGGQVFTEFRPEGPIGDEPANARHVYQDGSIPLQPWWPRYMAMDWGYRHHAAAFKFCVAPDGRLFVYDEMVIAKFGSREWGAELARWCQREFVDFARHDVAPVITLFLSPDAMGKRDETNTPAQSIAAGIATVLGDNSAEIFDVRDTEMDHWKGLEVRSKARIRIRSAKNQRVAGWNYIHELMRFTPVSQADWGQYDPAYAEKLLVEEGSNRYFAYMKSFEQKTTEVLPKLQISSRCRHLIDAIPTLASDPSNIEDVLKAATVQDDVADAWRYGCVAHPLYLEVDAMAKEERRVAVRPDRPRAETEVNLGFRVRRGASSFIEVM